MKLIEFSLLFFAIFLIGCLGQTNFVCSDGRIVTNQTYCINGTSIPGAQSPSGTSQQSGCLYNNPSCSKDYTCENNVCKEKTICGKFGCQSGESSSNCCLDCGCSTGKTCENNACVISESRLASDLSSYDTIIQQDFSDLDDLIDEGSDIVSYFNVDLSTFDQSHSVSAKDSYYIPVYLPKGYELSGVINVVGGANSDVYFGIKDSSDNKMKQLEKITDGYKLSFIPSKSDTYQFFLGNNFSTISPKTVTFAINSRYAYYSKYSSWATRYANKAEIITQHLTEYENYVKQNEDALKNAGYDTIELKANIADSKTTLKQSVTGVQTTLGQMENYFEQLAQLKEKQRQETEAAQAKILELLLQLAVGG